MAKRKWVSPTLTNLNSIKTIQSGVVCVGYEAAMGTPVAFYTSSTGLITVSDGCTSFMATTTCGGNNIKTINGNTCMPVATACS